MYLSAIRFLTGCFGGGGQAERGHTVVGRLGLCSCAESLGGHRAGGAQGTGQGGSRARRAPRSLFAITLRPQQEQSAAFAAREGEGWEAHTGPAPAAGFNPLLGAGRQRSWEALRAMGEADWIKSLSFTWAGVQPPK